MILLDAHCDTITRMMDEETDIYENSLHIDLERLKSTGFFHIQFFAVFVDAKRENAYSLRRALEVIENFYRVVEECSQFVEFCRTYKDIEKAVEKSKVAAILSIEGGEVLQGSIEVLNILYRLGVRSICLTWNYRNEIADGVGQVSGGGLTPFGVQVVKEMNRLGMIVDVSHISDEGFYSVIDATKQPIIASHSNARAICSHRRNLTDDQILKIRQNGGVIGINLSPDFLSNDANADIGDIIKHIEHIAGLTGEDHIGLGADFDGVYKLPSGFSGIQDVYKIFNELSKLNYSDSFIRKFASENFMRVIKMICK